MQDVQEILTELGFKGIEDAAKKHAWLILSGKIAKYEAENNFFKSKHRCDFLTFEKKIMNKTNNENFEEENDLLDWRFAYEQLNKYKQQIVKLQS